MLSTTSSWFTRRILWHSRFRCRKSAVGCSAFDSLHFSTFRWNNFPGWNPAMNVIVDHRRSHRDIIKTPVSKYNNTNRFAIHPSKRIGIEPFGGGLATCRSGEFTKGFSGVYVRPPTRVLKDGQKWVCSALYSVHSTLYDVEFFTS
jgi:hypothetical protein